MHMPTVVSATGSVDEDGPIFVLPEDWPDEIPGFWVLKAVFREDAANRVGSDDPVNPVRADDLLDRPVRKGDLHLRFVLILNQILREVIDVLEAISAYAVPKVLPALET